MHSPSERSTVDFRCALAAQTVQVQLDHTLNVSPTGKRMGRRLSGIDCSAKHTCPVTTSTGTDVATDWTKCVYVHPARTTA
jgi:hypothetical protein